MAEISHLIELSFQVSKNNVQTENCTLVLWGQWWKHKNWLKSKSKIFIFLLEKKCKTLNLSNHRTLHYFIFSASLLPICTRNKSVNTLDKTVHCWFYLVQQLAPFQSRTRTENSLDMEVYNLINYMTVHWKQYKSYNSIMRLL